MSSEKKITEVKNDAAAEGSSRRKFLKGGLAAAAGVGAEPAVEGVGTIATGQHIAAAPAANRVIAGRPAEGVVGVVAEELRRACHGAVLRLAICSDVWTATSLPDRFFHRANH